MVVRECNVGKMRWRTRWIKVWRRGERKEEEEEIRKKGGRR